MRAKKLPLSEALAGLREYQAQLSRRPIYSSERAGYIESELAEELGERIDDMEAALRSAEQPEDAATDVHRYDSDSDMFADLDRHRAGLNETGQANSKI